MAAPTSPDPAPISSPPKDKFKPRAPPRSNSLFAVPTPIKQLFDRFPLLTYPTNPLPLRAPASSSRAKNVLYIFADEKRSDVSFNPACLKWQTYLKFCGIDFEIRASCNHASPSGALPFLIPGSEKRTIASGKLQRWCREVCERSENGKMRVVEEPDDARYEAFLSLVDLRVRRAWLYTVYLSPSSAALVEPWYILPTSVNPFVRLSTAHDLRLAAERELLKHSAVINAEELYKGAEEAFAALEMLLRDDEWFFGATRPGLFDASVFAYTHLILGDKVNGRLREAVEGRKNIVGHRKRIVESFFKGSV